MALHGSDSATPVSYANVSVFRVLSTLWVSGLRIKDCLPLEERFSSLVVRRNYLRCPSPGALNQILWVVAWELEFLTSNTADTDADGGG